MSSQQEAASAHIAADQQLVVATNTAAPTTDDDAYAAAVQELKQMPPIRPPVPMAIPTLRPTPPVSKVERKRPIPLDAQLTMFEFEESTTRQSLLIKEQQQYTAIVVGSLQHVVTIGDKDVEANELAGREIIERADERERMCMREDFVAARHIILVRLLESIQRQGETLYADGLEVLNDIAKEEADHLAHVLARERAHRPSDCYSPTRWGTHGEIMLSGASPTRSSRGVLVPAPPPSNPFKLTGQIRFQEEQQRALDNKRKEKERNDYYWEEGLARMEIVEEESKQYMLIEAHQIEVAFALKNTLAPKRPPIAPQVEFVPQYNIAYDAEMRYNAAAKIQTLGRQFLARRELRTRQINRDAEVELMIQMDKARQHLLAGPFQEKAEEEMVAEKKAEDGDYNEGYSAFGGRANDDEEQKEATPTAAAEEVAEDAPQQAEEAEQPVAVTRSLPQTEAAPQEAAADYAETAPSAPVSSGVDVSNAEKADAAAPTSAEKPSPASKSNNTALKLLLSCRPVGVKMDALAALANALGVQSANVNNKAGNEQHAPKAAPKEAPETVVTQQAATPTPPPTTTAPAARPQSASINNGSVQGMPDEDIDAIITSYFKTLAEDATLARERVSLKYFDMLVESASTPEGYMCLRGGVDAGEGAAAAPAPEAAHVDAEQQQQQPAEVATSSNEKVEGTNTPNAAQPSNEPLTSTWKAVLQLAAEQGTDVATIKQVLAANDASPVEADTLEAVIAAKKAQLKADVIAKLPFCQQLLEVIVWDTRDHKYKVADYAIPYRNHPYKEEGAADELMGEEYAHLCAREEENSQRIVKAQIEGIMALKTSWDAVTRLCRKHVPAAYEYPVSPDA